jgi:diacylglycerol diphosphate phosphatase / phosphatidate phosphatase
MAGDTSRKAKITQDTGLYESLHRFWQKSYAGDYLGLSILLAAYLVIQFLGEPFHRMFRLDDARITFPHAEVERVSVCTSG